MKTVVIGILGTVLDNRGQGKKRWELWRPTVSICQQEDVLIDRFELLLDKNSTRLAELIAKDIAVVSPSTKVNFHFIDFSNPWDFESVYGSLLDFARSYTFKPQRENYFVHITTGTHVAQICLYLLNEAHYLPGKLLQTSPPPRDRSAEGKYQIIDLDLSKYDQIASRFKKEHQEGTDYLKGGIETRNKQLNATIAQLEKVSIKSKEPILIMGPTGAGKSQLAKRVYELRKQRGGLTGELVEVNCATLRGDNAMSTLFGHKKGSYTGATTDRLGLLKQADGGLLFLDEIGELGLDEQAMLLHAIETKSYMPLGSDKPITSNFQIIAGTNKDLTLHVESGEFREDLLARIDLWTYYLPSLKERLEDLEPNIDYELERYSSKENSLVSFNTNARSKYLQFARSPQASWRGNFRDLNASIIRMATLSSGGRINEQVVTEEIARLQKKWQPNSNTVNHQKTQLEDLKQLIGDSAFEELDYFEQAKLCIVVDVCRSSSNMAEAGRILFNKSRETKASSNDSHRVKQLLAKYDLTFAQIKNK
ncbi:DNA-binding transcriptional regulator RtcR [Sessilibacter sp. MAH1]